MVPIKEAISKGAWIHCEAIESFLTFQFRIKVLSFRKLNLSEIEDPEKINEFDSNAALWVMGLEFINLTKQSINSHDGPGNLILIDQDGFRFHVFTDRYIRLISESGKKNEMYRFYSNKLIPKIKVIGAIPFQLPDDDEASYSISLKNGSIHVV